MTMRELSLQRMALIFDEWNRQYSEDPEAFDECLDEDGKPVQGYGHRAANTFAKIADQMDAEGKLPHMP